jgi:hypothetical protein
MIVSCVVDECQLSVTVAAHEFGNRQWLSHTMSAGEHTALLLWDIVLCIDHFLYIESHAMKIRTLAFSLALLMPLASVSSVASAGCLKGAVVGGVAGHVAGKHSVLGAAAGCAVGHHMSKKKAREQAAADARAREQQRQANAAPQRR